MTLRTGFACLLSSDALFIERTNVYKYTAAAGTAAVAHIIFVGVYKEDLFTPSEIDPIPLVRACTGDMTYEQE